MYIPPHFRESNPDTLAAFLDAHAFGTLTTVADGKPFATHIPFLYERAENAWWGHVARANPQWRHFAASPDVLVMFLGPHGYVSPTWYASPGVPTWDYTAVHVYGTARAVDDPERTAKHVERLAARYERGSASPWVPSYDPRRLAGIVGVEIRIEEIQGKFKLSQNRSAEDRARVVARLAATGADNDAELARLVAAAAPAAEQ
jgi:transcriptional regulator